MKNLLFVAILAVLFGGLGWFAGRQGKPSSAPSANERKIAYYQSPMHPWIKSDQPGACTICGMNLTPVYEGEKGFETEGNVIALSSNSLNVIHVQTEPVQKRPVEKVTRVPGRIESDETRYRIISAYVDGRIEKLYVNYVGAEVVEGEPLAALYSPGLLAAQREYLALLPRTGDEGTERFRAEQQQLIDSAKERLLRLGLGEQQIEELARNRATNYTTTINAPISGTVVKRDAFEGQYVKEGDKLFEIADFSKMWFRFDAYEKDLPWLAPGMEVRVRGPGAGTNILSGKIVFIDPTLNDQTRSARVRVELDNPVQEMNGHPRRLLYNGLYAEGFIDQRTESVLTVPKAAILNPGDGARVWIDKGGGAFEERSVTPGREGTDYVEILAGVVEGENVVVNGNLLIDSQAQIRRPPSAPAPDKMRTESMPPLPPELASESQKLLDEMSEANSALAADDLASFKTLWPALISSSTQLEQQFKDTHHLDELTAKLRDTASKVTTETLDSTRKSYLPFSAAAAEFLTALRDHGGKVEARIFKCPMYPAPGKTAYWIQREAQVRNPFYGSEMLDCGSEVK